MKLVYGFNTLIVLAFVGILASLVVWSINVEATAPVSFQVHYYLDEEHNTECWIAVESGGISCLRVPPKSLQLMPMDIVPGGELEWPEILVGPTYPIPPNPQWKKVNPSIEKARIRVLEALGVLVKKKGRK